MRRSIVIVLLILLSVGIVAAGFAWQQANALATPTPADCQLIAVEGTPNIQMGLAIDTLYDAMPRMQTPVGVVVGQEKPFNVGCVLPKD
jgi:hypothetical protein